ncbi:RNA 2'-phosphotransferase, partial [bacterium]|nr:RNA 2'-phosphotransferase [bacterium]
MTDVTKISKTLSYWLRHAPEKGDLTLDAKGWAPLSDVYAALAREGLSNDFNTLMTVVQDNDKKRFEFNFDFSAIRARQGHSIDIDLDLKPSVPPVVLYHGTTNKVVGQIMKQGLSKMNRH